MEQQMETLFMTFSKFCWDIELTVAEEVLMSAVLL